MDGITKDAGGDCVSVKGSPAGLPGRLLTELADKRGLLAGETVWLVAGDANWGLLASGVDCGCVSDWLILASAVVPVRASSGGEGLSTTCGWSTFTLRLFEDRVSSWVESRLAAASSLG